MRPPRVILLLVAAVGCLTPHTRATVDSLVREGLAAEAQLDTRRALELFLDAEKSRPDDAAVLRKIARLYSDLSLDLRDPAEQRKSVERALVYSRRAVAADPSNAEGVLCLAVCYGKLALQGGARDRVRFSRMVREETVRALNLDPGYAWAHHLLGRWNHEVSALSTTARVVVRVFYGGLPDASTAEAVKHLKRAVELEPTQLQHHLELGFAHLANNEPDQARAAFTTGLAMPSREKHDEPAKVRARAALAQLP